MPGPGEEARPAWPLALPRSEAEIEAIRRERRRLALERARRSKLLRARVSGVDVDRLDDPEQWRKIPVLTKEELRKLPTDAFYQEFCLGRR